MSQWSHWLLKKANQEEGVRHKPTASVHQGVHAIASALAYSQRIEDVTEQRFERIIQHVFWLYDNSHTVSYTHLRAHET